MMGRIAGKYESDREDDRFESGNGIDQIRRDLDAKDRLINESRQSQGSFSELVMEEYDKMKINPMMGTRNDIENMRLDSNSPPK